jgi:hypothetical protein
MKTSKKILLLVAGSIIVSLVIYVVILRNAVQSKQSKAGLMHEYKTVSVDNFDKLDFSSHMIVRIKQGKDCEVEIITDKESILKPSVENINGTLHCMIDSIPEKENTGNIELRITMPLLQEIKATEGTEIHLTNFQADSLTVILENGCAFSGKNNTLKHVSFQTSGDNRLQITSTL